MPNASVPAATEGVPTIYRLLANYWGHYAAVVEAMYGADNAAEGTAEHAEADERQKAEGRLLENATLAICSFLPTQKVDARIKSNFLADLVRENLGHLSESETEALLSSLPHLIAIKDESE